MKDYSKDSIKIYVSDNSDWSSKDLLNEKFKDFFFVKQIHSWNIYFVENEEDLKNSRIVEYDWIITNLSNIKIGVQLADCNWIAIYWKEYIGIFHAGWGWLYNKIIENWIKLLKEKWEDINKLRVFVWPSIRNCCYEVWNEFLDYFDKKYFHENIFWKLNFDMISVIRDILDEAWINNENIEINNICTKCTKGYFSYRNWNLTERFVVWIEKIKNKK